MADFQKTGYTEERIPESLRTEAEYILIERELGNAAVAADVTIGLGENGQVTITKDTAGSVENLDTVTVEVADTASTALSASISDGDVTITLATDGDGNADDTSNTASAIQTEVDALSGVSATASGDGSGAIDVGFVGTYSFTGGEDAVAETDIASDFQIVKTPNDDLYDHVGDKFLFFARNDADYKILAVNLNGKWLRNF